MKKLSITEKVNGELAMRDLCEHAKKVYDTTDPLTVAKCEDGSFSIRGMNDADGLTFEQVQQMFLDIYEECYAEDEE